MPVSFKSSLQKYVNDHLNSLLRSMFKGVDFRNRFTVERETEQLSSDSLDVHNIGAGKRKEYFSIYFDNEFMCSFTDDTGPTEVDKLFLSGFLEAYEAGQIYLTPGLYLEEEKKRKKFEAEIEAAKKSAMEKDFSNLSSDEKNIATEVMKEVTKEKGHATTTA